MEENANDEIRAQPCNSLHGKKFDTSRRLGEKIKMGKEEPRARNGGKEEPRARNCSVDKDCPFAYEENDSGMLMKNEEWVGVETGLGQGEEGAHFF